MIMGRGWGRRRGRRKTSSATKAEWKVEVEAWNKAKAVAKEKKEAFSLPKPMVRGHLLPPEPKLRVEVEEEDVWDEDEEQGGKVETDVEGVVKAVACKKGEMVAEGKELVDIEPLEKEDEKDD